MGTVAFSGFAAPKLYVHLKKDSVTPNVGEWSLPSIRFAAPLQTQVRYLELWAFDKVLMYVFISLRVPFSQYLASI